MKTKLYLLATLFAVSAVAEVIDFMSNAEIIRAFINFL